MIGRCHDVFRRPGSGLIAREGAHFANRAEQKIQKIERVAGRFEEKAAAGERRIDPPRAPRPPASCGQSLQLPGR